MLGYLAAVGIGVSLINNGLKHIVERERPNELRLTSVSGFSFPSGHTAAAAACWAAICSSWPAGGHDLDGARLRSRCS